MVSRLYPLSSYVSSNDSILHAELSKTQSDATNRFFEARVAVMGFKCRTMQLQGELNDIVTQLI